MATFAELGLSEPQLEALAHLGYDQPTPIQEQAIPAMLAGRDVIGQAQTGTGKTAAFGLPLLEYVNPTDPEVQALVLTPTRELCIQVTQALRAYGEPKGVEVVAIFGGAPIRDQASFLRQGGQLVVVTCGRVMDMMRRHHLVLTESRFVVLDEADEMLDLGFLEDVETILSRCPSGRQTSLWSATVPPEIRRLAEKRMYDPMTIRVRAATLTIDTVDQFYVEVPDREKPEALARVLKSERPDQAIVFVRTKIGADRLARALGDRGVRVKALHGDMSQGSRDGVMIAFKGGRERLLVATDIAARGPRHTKPRRDGTGPRAKLLVGAGRAQGLEPADIIRAIVDNSHLEGEDVSGVRVLERFSFAEVPADRAPDVVHDVSGKRVRGTELRLEVTTR